VKYGNYRRYYMPAGNLKITLYLVCLCAIFANSLIADETAASWPHLRGPAYTAHIPAEEKLYLEWGDKGPPILWKRQIGQGFSGLIVVNNTIYTQMQTRAGQFVEAIDVNTGKTKWRTRYEWPWEIDSAWPGPYATPTFYNGSLFFTGCYGTAGKINPETGSILWSLDIQKEFKSRGLGFGYACTPLLYNNKLFVCAGGKGAATAALNIKDGTTAWSTGDDWISYCSPLLIKVSGRDQIVCFLQNAIVTYDPGTGKELWRDKWSVEGYDEHAAWPVYEEPYLFVSAPFRQGTRVLRLSYEGDTPKADLVWASTAMSNDVLSSVIFDGHIYGYDIHDLQARETGTKGEFKCIDLATGTVRWVSQKPGPAGVLAHNQALVLLNETGILIFAKLSCQQYEEITRIPVLKGERCWTQPTYYKGMLLVRGSKSIACIWLKDPKDIPSKTVPAQSVYAPLEKDTIDWMFGYLDRSTYEPGAKDFCIWFCFSLLSCLVLPLIVFILPIDKKYMWPGFISAGIVLSMVGGPLCSLFMRRFIFTLPAAMHGIFLILNIIGIHTLKNKNRIAKLKARISLVVFLGICAGYYFLCRNAFIIAGIGFLIGFLPASPYTFLCARSIIEKKRKVLTLVLMLISFTLFYWISILAIVFKVT
jgi:outer membrane protein assembly factor BamB